MGERSSTPGPWLRDGLTVYALDERKNANRFSFRVQEGYLHHTRHERIRTPAEELEATAALAQAAPDMFEALKNFVAEYVDFVESGDAGFWDPEKEAKVIAARAAIAKAEGLGQRADATPKNPLPGEIAP